MICRLPYVTGFSMGFRNARESISDEDKAADTHAEFLNIILTFVKPTYIYTSISSAFCLAWAMRCLRSKKKNQKPHMRLRDLTF